MSTEAAADLIIVGGGPAGISAAIEARWHGLSVLLLDENATLGGRIWQALEARGANDKDDADALQIVQGFRASGTEAHWRATVWAIERRTAPSTGAPTARHVRRAARLRTGWLPGRRKRPVPIPGWTLPGVMTVGAAQIALKTAGAGYCGRRRGWRDRGLCCCCMRCRRCAPVAVSLACWICRVAVRPMGGVATPAAGGERRELEGCARGCCGGRRSSAPA